MNIEEIKVGETYYARVKITGKSDKWVDFVTAKPSGEENLPVLGRSGFHYSELDDAIIPIPPTPKYDPYRWFKKGDKVQPRKVNGRCPFGVDITDSTLRHMDFGATVQEDEDQYGMVRVNTLRGDIKIHSYFLELVTPVEELEPYKVWDTTFSFNVGVEDSKAVFYYGADMSTCPYTKEQAKAAAEAERDRLNAEWRKEQNK